jgi:hypothetical protein
MASVMNQKPANRPLSNLLQTADSPDRVEQLVDGFPELVFRSPAIKETFGNITFVILIISFGFPVVVMGVVATSAGYQSITAGLLVLLALSLISLVSYFLLQRGRVVLKSDKLVEYNFLNHPQVSTYAQIFEVKRGTHADQTWIRYYSMGRNGQINYRSIKGRNLISVHRDAEMRHELSRRISAPEPIFSQITNPILIVLLLGILVIPVVVMVFYLLAAAVKR